MVESDREAPSDGRASEPARAAPPDVDARPPLRFAEPVASWVALGVLLGLVGPGSAMVWFDLEVVVYAPYLLGSGAVGVIGGALFGLVDPPTRWVPAAPFGRAILGGFAALVAVGVAGAAWSAIAGVVGSLAVAGVQWLAFGQDVSFFLGFAVPIGAALGLGVGSPIVALFALCRLVAGRWGRPWIGTLVGLLLGPTVAVALTLMVFPMALMPFSR